MTGVLPIALDRATRVVQVLLHAGKEYVCLMYVHKNIDEQEIIKSFEKFSGEIKQLPPVRSAVKREERKRKVYYVNVMEIDGQDILFRIGCQAGTYVRKYCHDLGKVLGCGAHMVQLVRTKVGPFTDNDIYTLYDLKDAYEFYKEGDESEIKKIVLPFEKAVDHLGKIWVFDGAVDPLCHGSPLYVPGVVVMHDTIQKEDSVAIFTLKDELICIGTAAMSTDEILKNEKGIVVTNTKVFMNRGTYTTKTARK